MSDSIFQPREATIEDIQDKAVLRSFANGGVRTYKVIATDDHKAFVRVFEEGNSLNFWDKHECVGDLLISPGKVAQQAAFKAAQERLAS